MISDAAVNKKNIVFPVFAAICLIAVLVFLSMTGTNSRYPIETMADHWDIQISGKHYEDVTLSDLDIGVAVEREVYIMKHTLPDTEVPAACLRTRTTHSSIVVYVDKDLIYEDGPQYVSENKMSPSYYHYIELPDEYAGKELTIHLWANESGTFSVIEPVLIGNVHDLYLYYLHDNVITLIAALFFTMIGILLMFIFILLWMNGRSEPRVAFSAMITFLIGVYMLGFFKLSNFFNSVPVANGIVEYVTLYLMPAAFVAFVAATQEGMLQKVCYWIAFLDVLIAAGTFFLHVMNFNHINRFVTLFHGIILIESIGFLSIALIRFIRSRRIDSAGEEWMLSDKVLMAGFSLMVVTAIAEVAKFNFLHYQSTGNSAYSSLSFITLGALLFVVSLILNFFYYHIERIYADDMLVRLSGLAYTDPLTDTANRSRCEEMMDKLEAANEDCTVCSLDIDHLKEINDKFGHAEGDRYLSNMAEILNDVFADADLLGRMGGDEFIAIYRGFKEKACADAFLKIDEAVASKNKTGDQLHYDISYGFATTREGAASDVRGALALADSRMYEMKTKKRKERRTV